MTKSFLILLIALLWTTSAAAAVTATVNTDHVRTQLIVFAPAGIAPGKEVTLGLRFTHSPGWHTYWKNPGDSGLPTVLNWTLPNGFSVEQIAWPTPKQLPFGPLMNFGYDADIVLPVKVNVPTAFGREFVDVKLHAEWLVCKEICLPESGDYALRIPVATPAVSHRAAFAAAMALRPLADDAIKSSARVVGKVMRIEVEGLPRRLQGTVFNHFPEDSGVFDYAAPISQRWVGLRLELELPLLAQRTESPEQIRSVIARSEGGTGLAFASPIVGGWQQPAKATNAPHLAQKAGTPPLNRSFLITLLLAFAGGALLNLMPCVFPVLAIKVFSLANGTGDRRAALRSGLAYSAGVIAAFAGLAGLMLLLRSAGAQLGWGFQLQSPVVVAALALLFSLIGLNLAGLFDIGSILPGSLAGYRAKRPMVDEALSGVLAAAVASPCTGPFMGAAVGAALTMPAPAALLLFITLGAGMAFPYLAASAWPTAGRLLPKPGIWMVRFKVMMSFPMFATVVWLVWVLGQQAGIDGVAGVLGLIVAVAFATWALVTPASAGARRVLAIAGAAVVIAAGTWAWPLLQSEHGETVLAGNGAASAWQPWSAIAVANALAQGQPVFVDFTAAWCVTCQFNKRTTLANDRLLRDFRAKNVVLMRADWTRRDPAITSQLAKFGRNGVPVYAFYSSGSSSPQLLSEILTVDEVRGALNRH